MFLSDVAGEIDAIAIDQTNQQIILCESTASASVYGTKNNALELIEAKFQRAEEHVRLNLSWLEGFETTKEFWAPYITEEKKAGVEALGITVVDAELFLSKMSELEVRIKDSHLNSLDPASQVVALLAGVRNKILNRNAHHQE